MRFSILVTAVAVASSSLVHAARVHHIYQSCKALPAWEPSYTAAMNLLQLTVKYLDVADAAHVPEDILRAIDGLVHPPKHGVYPLIRPGSVEWEALIEMLSWTLSERADDDNFFLVAPTDIRSACDNTPWVQGYNVATGVAPPDNLFADGRMRLRVGNEAVGKIPTEQEYGYTDIKNWLAYPKNGNDPPGCQSGGLAYYVPYRWYRREHFEGTKIGDDQHRQNRWRTLHDFCHAFFERRRTDAGKDPAGKVPLLQYGDEVAWAPEDATVDRQFHTGINFSNFMVFIPAQMIRNYIYSTKTKKYSSHTLGRGDKNREWKDIKPDFDYEKLGKLQTRQYYNNPQTYAGIVTTIYLYSKGYASTRPDQDDPKYTPLELRKLATQGWFRKYGDIIPFG